MISTSLKKYNANFETYEIPPGIYEVSCNNNTLDNSVKANVCIAINTLKSRLKTNKKLRFA